jgi:NAD-dependent dihydropyrimidine dehydrogenase PreA subunit
MGTDHDHRVCTYAEAESIMQKYQTVYVNDCFCRTPAKNGKEKWKYCGHPTLTCISFKKFKDGKMGEMEVLQKEIDQSEGMQLIKDWKQQGLFFRFMSDDSLCLCCSCGCGWFRDEEGNRCTDSCDPSSYIEKTNDEMCTLCGICVDICAYDARKIENDHMLVISEKCSGCSACEYACPENAITMVSRIT